MVRRMSRGASGRLVSGVGGCGRRSALRRVVAGVERAAGPSSRRSWTSRTGHAGSGGDFAERGGREAALDGDADDRVGDLSFAHLVIDSPRHGLYDTYVPCRWLGSPSGAVKPLATASSRWRTSSGGRWPDPPAALDVDAYAGARRVYRWPGAGEPIVFLHSMGGTGLTWSPYVKRLIGRDLYAIDTIGDVGRSRHGHHRGHGGTKPVAR